MTAVDEQSRARKRQDAFTHGLVETSARGVVGQTAEFATVLEQVSRAFSRHFAESAESLRFPPVMARADLHRIGYFRNFPQLLGSIHCFCGNTAEHEALVNREPSQWDSLDQSTDLVLTPAACYPVYLTLARRGACPACGHLVEVRSFCFRREPSDEPTRMQSFQMHEVVRVGTPEQVLEAKAGWMDKAVDFFGALQLRSELVTANDPFFGRAGIVLRKGQKSQNLKHELVLDINEGAAPTACMSFNAHLDHFGKALSLQTAAGDVAHTACVGIGLERTTLALFRHHGPNTAQWPKAVTDLLSHR